jgi:hypothetical protein
MRQIYVRESTEHIRTQFDPWNVTELNWPTGHNFHDWAEDHYDFPPMPVVTPEPVPDLRGYRPLCKTCLNEQAGYNLTGFCHECPIWNPKRKDD